MPTPRGIVRTGMTRVWLQEGGAGPGVAPEYMGVWRAGAVSWDQGEATPIYIPGDDEYDKFQEVASIAGTPGKPSLPLTARYSDQLSEMLRMTRRGCPNDLQIHIGLCEDLQDFTEGWRKIVALEKFSISNYSTGELGALSPDERAAVDETINAQGVDLYEIMRLTMAEICAANVVQEVIGVTFCDSRSCGGECGTASDGCQRLFALVKAVGGSPGLGPQVIHSANGGSTCGATPITTLAADSEPTAIACLGKYIVVTSSDNTDYGHHFALTAEILEGTETWQEQQTGYEAGGVPNAIFALKAGYAWVVGAGGYIYFLDNPNNAPTVLDAGSATAQDLNDVHAYDETHILAVGAANAVVYSTDGTTFAAVTGPAPAVALNCCWMKTTTEWWVGTAGGELYYTTDSGVNWTAKAFPGSGAGVVRDIVFATNQVGYLAHDNAIAGVSRILRTIDGGYQWYVLPEGTGSIPANDRINSLAVCKEPNVVIGGGLADNGTDGILIKGS